MFLVSQGKKFSNNEGGEGNPTRRHLMYFVNLYFCRIVGKQRVLEDPYEPFPEFAEDSPSEVYKVKPDGIVTHIINKTH